MRRHLKRTALALTLAAAGAGMGGCDDVTGSRIRSPTELVLVDAGGNEVSFDKITGTATGGITVRVGETERFRAFMRSGDGEVFAVEGVVFTLRSTVTNPRFAEARVEGADRLVLTGRERGNTSLIVQVIRSTGLEEIRGVFPLSVTGG